MKLTKILGLALGLAMSTTLAAQAQEISLRSADIHPDGYPTVEAVKFMGQLISERTNGRIKVQVMPSSVLGSEKDTIEQTRFGVIDLNRVNAAPFNNLVKETVVLGMPFLFRSTEHMHKTVDGPIGDEILAAFEPHGLIGLTYYDSGARSFYTTKKPIEKLADLKGMKIRVQGNPVFIDTINAMGGNGIAMATGEIFSALQTGVIDGAENNMPTLLEHNHYQNAKFYTLTEHLILPEPVVMSKTTWTKLSPEQQALVKKLAVEAQAEERVLWDKKSADSEAKLKAAGVEFITLTPAQKKAFYDATASVRAQYGAPYADLIKRIEAVQ